MSDALDFQVHYRGNPMSTWPRARKLIETWVHAAGPLAPTHYWADDSDVPEPLALDVLEGLFVGSRKPFMLQFRGDPDIHCELTGFSKNRDPGGNVLMDIPYPRVANHGDLLVELAVALCRHAEPLYGWAHSRADISLADEPLATKVVAPEHVHQAYWLTVLGPPLVEKIGTERVATTPAHRVVMLPKGGAVIVTSPDPTDVLSRSAREAQARALAHLRPELGEAAILESLLARSAQLARRAAQPPKAYPVPREVTEWLAAADAPPSDVDDHDAAITRYDDDADDFIAGYHDLPLIPYRGDALAAIDTDFLERDYWDKPVSQLEDTLVPALGAYVGWVLVEELDGEWVPRKNLDETQVVVGDRAWLPFLRVRRFVQSRDATVEYSLATFFAEARRVSATR